MWTWAGRFRAFAIVTTFCLLTVGAVDANSLWSDDCVFSFDLKTTFQTTDTICVTGDIDYVAPGQILPAAYIYIVANREWQLGDLLVDILGDPTLIESSLPAGSFLSEVVQLPPLQPGDYDLVLDEYPYGVYDSHDLVVGAGTDFAFRVESDVLFNDGFETGTCFQWSNSQTLCATPGVGLRIEITWLTPADPDPDDAIGSDLDLHLLHPDAGGDWLTQHDCYPGNPSPDWGVPGLHENPVVILADDDGAGPEALQITDPETVSYDVGVHYVDDLSFGFSSVTMKVWIDGVLTYEYPEKTLFDDEFWHLGSVQWPGGAVSEVDTVTTGFP